jgi:hypothetical protein
VAGSQGKCFFSIFLWIRFVVRFITPAADPRPRKWKKKTMKTLVTPRPHATTEAEIEAIKGEASLLPPIRLATSMSPTGRADLMDDESRSSAFP